MKVYSFVVVLQVTVNVILLSFILCLCIHCVLKVPSSMVFEFPIIQQSSTKVQLKGFFSPF